MKKEQVTGKLNLSIWKDFFEILKPYKKDFFALVLIMIVTAAFDTIFPLMTKYSIDNFVVKKTTKGIGLFALIYSLGAISFSFIIYMFISMAGKLETKMAYDIRKLAFKKLQVLSLSYKDNIRYGNLDANDKDIINVCKLLNIDEFIMKLENGYNTEIGEGGGLLSTGQKQLLSFARDIVRNPRLFVLDKATSSIDTERLKQ